MGGVSKAGIYVDSQKLYEILYLAQFHATKSDRIAIFPHMLNTCLAVKSNFVLSYVVSDVNEKTAYVEKMISEFEVLKSDIILMNKLNIVKSECILIDKNGPHNETVENTSKNTLRKEIINILERMEGQCKKWEQSLRA